MIRGLDKVDFESQGLEIIEQAERTRTPYSSRCKSCCDPIPRAMSEHTEGYCLECGLEKHYNDARAATASVIDRSVEKAETNQQSFQSRPAHVRKKMGTQIGG